MRKRLFMAIFSKISMIIIPLCLMAGCKKEPVDPGIEGMWRLERFVTKSDGVVHNECQRIFYSIQLQLVVLAEKNCTHGYGIYIGAFCYGEKHKTVMMKDFKTRKSSEDDGELVEVEKLNPYGINSSETVFQVVKKGGKQLVLDSEYATLYFSRF